jgi:hypothetical protein
VALPLDAAKLELPEYLPVIWSLPAGAVVALHDPDPLTRLLTVHNAVEPSVNETEPVGVPPVEVTEAE